MAHFSQSVVEASSSTEVFTDKRVSTYIDSTIT